MLSSSLKFNLLVFLTLVVSALAPQMALSSDLVIVPNDQVCMVNDTHFGRKQIPVAYEDRTYFGCCENCKKTLVVDSKARTAVDPVTGKKVDKSKALIAARADHSVIYFENKKSFDRYSDLQKERSSSKAK